MLATQRGSILYNFGHVSVFLAICLIRLHQYISYKNAIISKGIKIIPSYFNFAKFKLADIKSYPNIWTSVMHIVRHRVQLTITSSIRQRTFQVKMRHTCSYYLRPLWIDCREFFSIERRCRNDYFIRWTTTTKSFQIIADLSKLQKRRK